MDGLAKLMELQALYELKARRDYALDTKDWDLYARLHADDYVAEHIDAAPVTGGQVVAALLRKRLDGVTTVHHSHTPLIVFDGPDNAHGTWAMEDSLHWKEDGVTHWMRGSGYYHERYVKRDGQWLFQSRNLERLHVETSDPDNPERVDRSGENHRYRA